MEGVRVKWIVFSIVYTLFWMSFSPLYGFVLAKEPARIQIVKTYPDYAEEIKNLDKLVVIIQFNREMDPNMQEDFLMDQRGAIDAQGNPIEIKGQFIWRDSKTIEFKPSEALKPNSTYQVSLFSVRTKEGEESDDVPFRLVFTTGKGQ
jgi:hypothetical protein